MDKILITILVLGGTIGLYIVSYVLNKRTPVPEGIDPIADCDACKTISCHLHPENSADVKEDIKKCIEEDEL